MLPYLLGPKGPVRLNRALQLRRGRKKQRQIVTLRLEGDEAVEQLIDDVASFVLMPRLTHADVVIGKTCLGRFRDLMPQQQ